MKNEELKKVMIDLSITLKDCLKRLDQTASRTLIVVAEDDVLEGVISDGDIRRALLEGNSLDDSIESIYNTEPFFLKQTQHNQEAAKKLMLEKQILLLPIVDESKKVVDAIAWRDCFNDTSLLSSNVLLNIPTVIMAGGKGTRLAPFTDVLPKPLIPINKQTILEHIFTQFSQQGSREFYLTLNYKKDLIKAYLNSLETECKFHYVEEDDYYGTAGSLSIIKESLPELFVFSNCDVLVDLDFGDAIQLHQKKNAVITIISALQHHQIPYGVIESNNAGQVSHIVEKPEHSVLINTGVYIVSHRIFDYIPEDTKIDMPTVINQLLSDDKTVLNYMINESDYTDIGQWKEYHAVVGQLSK